MTLTDAQVKAEKPGSTRRRLSDGGGLLLEVDPAGGKYWIWRHRFPPTKDGKQQDYRIGPYPKISLKKARQIRDEQKTLMQQRGHQPLCSKKRGTPAATGFSTTTDDLRVRCTRLAQYQSSGDLERPSYR